MENRRGHGTPSRARTPCPHRNLAHRPGVLRLSRSERIAFRSFCPACAPQPRVRCGHLLSLLHPQAQGPPHLRGLHRDGLLHQGRAAVVEGHRAAPRHQARRDYPGWRVERPHRALPGFVRTGAGGGDGFRRARQDRSRRHTGSHPERHPPMTIEELHKIAQAERDAQKKFQHHVCVCVAAGCLSSGAGLVRDALKMEVVESGMQNEVLVKGVGCMGLCSAGPLVSVETGDQMFAAVTPENAPEIIRSMDTGGDPVAGGLHPCPTNVPFFQRQKKIVLENSGLIDPERIEDYIAHDGYLALVNAITEMAPQEVIDKVKSSGLRGRGGAGYPTGLKWSTVAKTGEQQKYVICNADEGDPGAFMDRAVLESDPHRVLEGMAIAAFAIGAQKGYIYVRAEYPLAVKHLKGAIKQAERIGLLGNSICGTRFSFHIDIRLGAGAFVCGEETALIASIEGKRGTPRPRPPFPAESGLWECPTLINNVETFANIAPIVRHGAECFAAIGPDKSKGPT